MLYTRYDLNRSVIAQMVTWMAADQKVRDSNPAESLRLPLIPTENVLYKTAPRQESYKQ